MMLEHLHLSAEGDRLRTGFRLVSVDSVISPTLFNGLLSSQRLLQTEMVYQVESKTDFLNVLAEAGDKLVLIDFYATWCGPCKAIAPKLEAMSREFTDVVFIKVDVDECEELATDYNISCMPTFVFLKSGERVSDFSGANEEALRQMILQHK